MPAGTKGSTAIATTAAARAIASGSRALSRGARSARNAAGGAASRPNTFGSGMASVARAPISVPAFQNTKSASPVTQKARRLSSGSSRAIAMAVVSSITKWAARARFGPRAFKIEDSLSP